MTRYFAVFNRLNNLDLIKTMYYNLIEVIIMRKSIEVETLCSLVESGLSSIEIAKIYGMHQGTVSAILKRAGCLGHIELLKNNAKSYALVKTKNLVENLHIDFDKQVNNNISLTAIATEYGIAPQTLRKYLEQYRPELIDVFKDIGKLNKSNFKVTNDMIDTMIELSNQGIGIDTIGKILHIDGTTVRSYLIKILGEDVYKKLHPQSRYLENNGWNGKRIFYKGSTYQSQGEIEVAKCLYNLGLDFDLHKRIKVCGKNYVPDFYIQSLDLYIEYAGILTQRFYRVKFMKKVNDYSGLKLNFIVVNNENIDQLETFIKERSDV